MSVSLASAVPQQFPDVLTFWLMATEVPSSTDDLEGLTALWSHEPDALIVATDDEAIVGTLIASWDGWRGAYYRLAVHPARRHQGIARALVDEGEARLRQCGARRISLYAVAAHTGAVALWDALGYQPDHRDIRFVRDLGQGDPA